MNKEDFLAYCRNKEYTEKELSKIESAVEFAKAALSGRKRLSGEPFYEHNLRVAQILAETKPPIEIILAGLLHGLPVSISQIKEKFGMEVSSLLSGLEEIREIKSKNTEAEVLRKVLLTTLKDVRVILIALANKLDNLRTIEVLPRERQEKISQEVLDVYAPLAYRLGADKIRIQLEDLAFRNINPRKYQEIENFLKESSESREKEIIKIIELIKKIAFNKVPLTKIKGRPKHIYSIFKKMTQRGVPLNEQFDLYGIRIITPTEKDCYSLLGLLHEKFEPVPGKLKDYIANPKPNLYRSIHTVIAVSDGKMIEIQIRTLEMDEFAEEGIAAHWKYKKVKSDESFEKRVSWLKGILELQKNEGDKEFLEAAKVDVFGDSIYCYTPKGAMKEMPLGSTLLDFAFAVHEQVGVHAVGGKINGKFVPLRTELPTGAVVEIITNKNQRPHRSWIKIVKSPNSRQKIRKYLREFEKLPDLHYRAPKTSLSEEDGSLVEAVKYPASICMLAKCCHALPGEEIIGIIIKSRVISVHKSDCRFALKEEERWIPVKWREGFSQKIRFTIVALERSGLLADLLHTIAQAGFEVKEAKAKLHGNGEMECYFSIIPRKLEHVKEMVRRVMKVKGAKRIWFE